MLALLIGAGMAVLGAMVYLLVVTNPISGAELEGPSGRATSCWVAGSVHRLGAGTAGTQCDQRSPPCYPAGASSRTGRLSVRYFDAMPFG